ncbi:vesicle-associated membrane protein 713 [Quercus suber]|uniref:Vesicle-associated membrane protein 713 n=1 Tax=Quercus suber TaxID=58331 RepID=A0AAW0K2S1_QUESU
MMGIFYCLVARGNVVLAESSAAATATNASSLARQVLEKTMQAAKDNSNASYSHDRCIFHVKRTDGLTFVKTYGRAILSAPAYAMNEEFSRVQSVMIDNIEKVLDRGDRLALLVDKTTSFQGSAVRFNRSSRRFKNTLWWRNAKLMFALVAVLLIIIYVVLSSFLNRV